MTRFIRLLLRVLLALAVLSVVVAASAEPPPKKTYEADKGADKVDVSGFPAEIQDAYKVFAAKCSRCHTLARPINTNMSTNGWKMYVKRMMNKPDSGISPAQGKRIYKFLKFYQQKKDGAGK